MADPARVGRGRRRVCIALSLCAFACANPAGFAPQAHQDLPRLWRAPDPPSDGALLRIEPRHAALRIGDSTTLGLEGRDAADARCSASGRTLRGPEFRIEAPVAPGVVDVVCRSGEAVAYAQVTVTDAAQVPLRDPYAGGVVLFKTRRNPRGVLGPVGTRATGLPALDGLLEHFGAYALPAFPFDRSRTRDRVGLDHWLVIDIPEDVNFFQAVARLRAHPEIYPASYLFEDAGFFRVGTADWAVPLEAVRDVGWAVPPVQPEPASHEQRPAVEQISWELQRLGVAEAWEQATGRGVLIAVVDTGVDVNHLAVSSSLRFKQGEGADRDLDGNGIPGDAIGANFAHLAIIESAHPGAAPRLALGLIEDVSDWDGAASGPGSRPRGHGTAIAALAAGSGASGQRPGVAPGATIMPVDVQENLEPSGSPLPEDPRMRTTATSLRAPVWSRAVGVAYAAAEGARLLTCAWPPQSAHWILHDVLQYAEDNCALPVCAVEAPADAEPGYPARWRRDWLNSQDLGTGAVLDVWESREIEDFFQRPLAATLLVGALGRNGRPLAESAGTAPDLRVVTGRSRRGVEAAVANPGNDREFALDATVALRGGPAVASALVAGTAALLVEVRPDLDPRALRDALLAGTRSGPPGRLNPALAPRALAAARALPRGYCDRLGERLRRDYSVEHRPWWQRVRVRTSIDSPIEVPGSDPWGSSAPPASEDGVR